MSFAPVKKGDGSSVIVSNTVKNSAGGDVVVSDDALDGGAGAHTVFGATVPVTPVKIVNFKLQNNRVFSL